MNDLSNNLYLVGFICSSISITVLIIMSASIILSRSRNILEVRLILYTNISILALSGSFLLPTHSYSILCSLQGFFNSTATTSCIL